MSVKEGITELQERLEYLRKSVCPFSKWHSWREVRMAQRLLKYFAEKKENILFASWARWEAQRKGLVDLERRCQDISREIQMLNKRKFPECDQSE